MGTLVRHDEKLSDSFFNAAIEGRPHAAQRDPGGVATGKHTVMRCERRVWPT